MLLWLAAAGAWAATPLPLIAVDFSQAGAPHDIKQKGAFKGLLPVDVEPDFPTWNQSEAVTEKRSENGRGYLRFTVNKLDQPVLFRLTGQNVPVPGYYEVRVVCRCPDAPLNVHVRIVPKPYTTLGEADTATGAGWDEQRFVIQVANVLPPHALAMPDASDTALYLSLGEGVTDIASVTLWKSDRAAYVAANSAGLRRPAKGLVNLFRNSRFPLGLQSGWSFRRDNMHTAGAGAVADPATPGPSGAPSLKIRMDKLFCLYSEPIQTDDPARPLQIAFAFKAQGAWRVSMCGVSKPLPASDQWQTLNLSVTPNPLSRGEFLIFDGQGTLYLDSLMAYSGEAGRAYASAGECEIALAPADGELAETRIQFADQPAILKYGVTGRVAGATLKAKVVSLAGMERALPDVSLAAHPGGTLDFGLFPEAPLGQFRVEAWAERDGQRVSPCNELVMTRIRRPVYWGQDAPNSPFGGHFAASARIVTTMKAAGMNWERFNDSFMEGTCWGWLEREKGQWTFSDADVAAYRKGKVKILGYLGSAPTWASYYPGIKSPAYFDYMYQPKDLEAFRNYVRTIATRYRGVIDEYQFQNEPWGAIFWHQSYNPATNEFGQGDTPAQDYARLAKIAYAELKCADPNAMLYGFNTAAAGTGDEKSGWTEAVFKAGGYADCDLLDYHYYHEDRTLDGTPGDPVATAYRNALGYLKAQVPAPMKPVVMSEGNPTRNGTVKLKNADDFTGLYKHTLPWAPRDDKMVTVADMTCRFVVSHLAQDVKRIFLYSDHCYHNILSPPPFPVLLAADGYPYPTLAAFSNLAWLLENKKIERCLPVGQEVWAYVFAGAHSSVAVISGRPSGVYTVPRAKGLEAFDLFGNPLPGGAKYTGTLLYLKCDGSAAALAAVLRETR